ncbi:MAG: hypothetical protein RSA62_06575, partial [Oscillospiraceae bacterium]
LLGIVYPGTIKWYFAPSIKQAAEIAQQVFAEIQAQYPGLCAHWYVSSMAQEKFELRTIFGSVVSISAITGGTACGVLAEEVAQEADKGEPFDFDKYTGSILPAVRAERKIKRELDDFFPQFQKLYITSAGRRQNPGFEYRRDIFADMMKGKSAFVIDIPAEVAVLSHIRSIVWYNDLKRKLTPELWLREMMSVWTGVSENPLIRDAALSESRNLMVMEDRHCGDPKAIYIVSYDVSYSVAKGNAMCATAVLKCEEQGLTKDTWFKRDRYLKSFVYVCDNPPPVDNILQARQLKSTWFRYCLEQGEATYISIDANQYGKAVLEALHTDLNDGLPPLCCVDHDLQDMELDGALPVIFPIRATPGMNGVNDPDGVMIQYMEVEFEQRNIRLLTSNLNEGICAYKKFHRIKDDGCDASIALPYIKAREACGQIANLKKKVSGAGMSEVRISTTINRDMWSAMKYGGRAAQKLETKRLKALARKANPWAQEFKETALNTAIPQNYTPRISGRAGGNKV